MARFKLFFGNKSAAGPALFLRPIADISDGTWTTDTGGTSLFAVLDEVTQSDTDYVRSSENPVDDVMEVNIGSPSGSILSGTLRFTVGKELNNAVVVDVRVELRQGGSTIATWNYLDVAFGFALKSETLTSGQRALVAPGVDLYVRITANPSAGTELRDRFDAAILLRDGSQVYLRV